MEVGYSKKAQEDITYWKKTGNVKMMSKISSLIEISKVTPFSGIGKPEPLKYDLTGLWSRRINREHRLVYEVSNQTLYIHSLKGHYE